MTADLAITGGPLHNFFSYSCAMTWYKPTQYVAWWVLTFPVDTVYITNVTIYFRLDGKFSSHVRIIVNRQKFFIFLKSRMLQMIYPIVIIPVEIKFIILHRQHYQNTALYQIIRPQINIQITFIKKKHNIETA